MKRTLDLILATILLLILILPMIIIFLILKLFYTTKPIYFSKRIGKNNKIFLMPKFRTMVENAPQVAKSIINKKYITNFGKFLRKFSLDEFPQFFSVLFGTMSLVGPRPALYNQKKLIFLRTRKRIHNLYPGITGWAQINGRDKISIYKKVHLDYFYYNNISLMLDIKIIFLTIIRVFSFKNILH